MLCVGLVHVAPTEQHERRSEIGGAYVWVACVADDPESYRERVADVLADAFEFRVIEIEEFLDADGHQQRIQESRHLRLIVDSVRDRLERQPNAFAYGTFDTYPPGWGE